MSEETIVKKSLNKPSPTATALRDHRIYCPTKEKLWDIQVVKGKTKFSEIPDKFHDTVIIEKLF